MTAEGTAAGTVCVTSPTCGCQEGKCTTCGIEGLDCCDGECQYGQGECLSTKTTLRRAGSHKGQVSEVGGATEHLRRMPSQLTGLRTAKFATGMHLAMRI